MLVFCLINVNIVAFSYLLDTHREISIEAGVFAIMLRNFWSYDIASYASTWLTSQGIANTYYEIAGISFGVVLLLTGAFWMYGKRMKGLPGVTKKPNVKRAKPKKLHISNLDFLIFLLCPI